MSKARISKDRVPDELLVPALGAIIFASEEPVPIAELTEVLGGVEKADIEAALDDLTRIYDRSEAGLRLERVAGGYRLATRPDTGAWVRRLFQHRNRTRLTPAALETLAIVAYRQPVTAPEIQAIRGKDSSASLRSLLDKKMLRILGKKKVVGSPLLYGTRRDFLVHFGLDSISELPSIDEFDEFVGVLDAEQGSLLAPPTEEPEFESIEEDTDAVAVEPSEPAAPSDREPPIEDVEPDARELERMSDDAPSH